MLELEGIYAPSYEISFLKVTIFHHPEKFGRKIRLVFNIKLKMPSNNNSPEDNKVRKEIEIFLNTRPGVKFTSIEDLSHKINTKYAMEIGACWDPKKLKRLRITNIPKEKKKPREKFPYYFNSKSGKIKMNLKFKEESIEDKEKENEAQKKSNKEKKEEKEDEEKEGMIFFALDLEGNFLEEDPWWKKILGVSSYAWEFPYVFWSHNEKSLTPTRSIGKCEEAQTFIIIPKKMIKSINRVSCIPGSDQLHEMTDNDIATYCESEKDEKKIRNIKKWVEPGSYSLAWKIPNTLKLSKKIVLGHLDAYPRLPTALLFSFIILVCLIYLFTPFSERKVLGEESKTLCDELEMLCDELEALCDESGTLGEELKAPNEEARISFGKLKMILAWSLIVFIILYFYVSAINYSFHNIRQSQLSRGFYETGGIALSCFLISFGLYGPIPWGFLIGKGLSEIPSISWAFMLFPTLFIFIFFSFKKEMRFYPSHDSKLTAAMIIFSQCIIIFAISIFFAYTIEQGDSDLTGLEKYLTIFKYWSLNNLYAIIGIKGLHKLIEY